MEFQPFRTVIIPAERGPRIPGEKRAEGPRIGLPEPREVELEDDVLVLLDSGEEATGADLDPDSGSLPVAGEPAPPPDEASRGEAAEEEEEPVAPTRAEGGLRAGTGEKRSTSAKRDFIVAYDGIFVGHYRSLKRITNRTAFQNILRHLVAEFGSVDPSRLQIFKPVPLKVTPPSSMEEVTGGSYRWFKK